MLSVGRVETMTLGQMIYVIINSNPDGVTTSELLAKVWERNPHACLGDITDITKQFDAKGYVLHEGERWYAPGPTLISWKVL